jgi:hypothetical protein
VSGEHGGFPPNEAEVELSALRGGAAERTGGNRHSPRWRMLRGGGVLVALALVAGSLLYSVRYTPAQAPPGADNAHGGRVVSAAHGA